MRAPVVTTQDDPTAPVGPPGASKGMFVPSLYFVTFKLLFVQHCVPIETVWYELPSISATVLVPQEKAPPVPGPVVQRTPV